MYEEKEVGFLLDPEDTLASYTKDRYTDRPSEEVEKKRVIDGLVNVAGRDVALCVLQGSLFWCIVRLLRDWNFWMILLN